MDATKLSGGCLCGAVRFEAALPSLFCCHCHCAWCRRAHGAAFVTWVGVRDEGFAVVAGADGVRWYASSTESDRGFCSTCGTTMFFRSKLAPGEMHLALACVDGPIDREPTLHVFYDARVPWFTPGDDLLKADRDHAGLRKYQVLPRAP
jgi:hypothetical protein